MRARVLLFLLLGATTAFGQNRTPTVRDTTFFILKNQTYSGSLRSLVTDPDPGQTLTFSPVVGSIQNGTLDLDLNGLYRFTPTPDFQGRASFSFTVCDNGTPIGCAVAGGKVNLILAPTFSEDFELNGRTTEYGTGSNGLTRYLRERCWEFQDMVINRSTNPAPITGDGSLVSGPLSNPNQNVSALTPILTVSSPLRVQFSYRFSNLTNAAWDKHIRVFAEPTGGGTPVEIITIFINAPVTSTPVAVDQTISTLPAGDYRIRFLVDNQPTSGGTTRWYLDDIVLTNAEQKFATATDCNDPTPVTLSYFRAQALDANAEAQRRVRLTWATANERDNERFELEHSSDLRTFTTVGTIAGSGTVATGRAYEYVHAHARPGTNYYRLKQIDTDGTEHTLRVVAVTFEGAVAQAYPNPTRDQVTIQLSGGADREAVLTGTRPDGRVALRETVRLDASGSTTLRLRDWAPGLYLLRLEMAGQAPIRVKVLRAE